MTGAVVMVDEQAVPWRIEYEIRCDGAWATRGVRLKAHAGDNPRDLALGKDAAGRWAVKRVSQRYSRIAERVYRYDDLPTGFTAEIVVDEAGLVVSYPPGWERACTVERLRTA